MSATKLVYLHFSHYDDGNYRHMYYFGSFALVNEQLKELIGEDLPSATFELTTEPFKPGINAIKLFD